MANATTPTPTPSPSISYRCPQLTYEVDPPTLFWLVLTAVFGTASCLLLYYSFNRRSYYTAKYKRLYIYRQMLVSLSCFKILKDMVLYSLLPLLPDCTVCHTWLYEGPVYFEFCALAFWVTSAYLTIEEDGAEVRSITSSGAFTRPNTGGWKNSTISLFSRWYGWIYVTLVVISLTVSTILDLKFQNTPKREVATSGALQYAAVSVLLLFVVGYFIGIGRLVYTKSEINIHTPYTDLVIPILRRLKFCLPVIALNFLVEISAVIVISSVDEKVKDAVASYAPFVCVHQISWQTIAWVSWFNILVTFLWQWSFAARPLELHLKPARPIDATWRASIPSTATTEASPLTSAYASGNFSVYDAPSSVPARSLPSIGESSNPEHPF
eukprot:TRINITY_DN60735_c0_g1_i1.p1 TRINITY_DN60735_c0_g1~~TRINITY_DN60735_c0_g1_i1.p1  ORF type:complete len:382 (+),score=11.78 TRINITY_DN60735_c0_g1_i1:53-1198(+)